MEPTDNTAPEAALREQAPESAAGRVDDTPPIKDALAALPWAELIDGSNSPACEDLHKTLSTWLGQEAASPLWRAIEPLLSLFVSLELDAETPFLQPETVEAIPQDLLTALVELSPEIGSDDARARILDVAWLRRVCDFSKVADAVAAYVRSADLEFDPSSWLRCYTRFKRAVELGASIGRQQQPFLDAVAAVEKGIDRAGLDDPLWLVHRLIKLLAKFGAGDTAKHADMAHELAIRARQRYESDGVGNGLQCDRERGYLDLEIQLRRRLQQDTVVRPLDLEVAEAFVRQAEGVIEAGWPAAKSVAEGFVGSAIKRLRQIGGEKARIATLRTRQEVLQREAIAEMKPVEISADVSDAVKAAKAAVADQSPVQALLALISLHRPPTLDDLEEEVRLKLKKSVFRALVPQTYLGPRGTVLAHHAGAVEETGFELETMRIAHERQSTIGSILLHPAAEQVRYEHGLDIEYFLQLCNASPFVPRGREFSFARALAAGMRGDYELAALLLCPQLEHAIREHFFARGLVTTTYPTSGIQNEFDLNRLLRDSNAAEFFGDELAYDLRVLLVEKVLTFTLDAPDVMTLVDLDAAGAPRPS
jgi:hypothetical protein